MIFRRRKHDELDKRVEQATEEAAQSRERLERFRENVIDPLQDAGSRDQFAEIIRRSLIDGHGGV